MEEINLAKNVLEKVYGIPANLIRTLLREDTKKNRRHGAVVLVEALSDPSAVLLLSNDMETGGYNPKLYKKIGMGHKVFQVGAALTVWSKKRETVAICSAGAYNPEIDDGDMAPVTLKWYRSDDRAIKNLKNLQDATNIAFYGDSDVARKEAANQVHTFMWGWQSHLLERGLAKSSSIRWIGDNPVFDPHVLSDFLRTHGFEDLPELPTLPAKNKKTGKVESMYRFIHDSHTLQYAAAVKINSKLKKFGLQDPDFPDWSGLGAWLNKRVNFPKRNMGGANDDDKHNAAVDAATMAFDYMDAHDVLQGDYELKPVSEWK